MGNLGHVLEDEVKGNVYEMMKISVPMTRVLSIA